MDRISKEAVADFRHAQDLESKRLACCRHLKRGKSVGLSQSELIDGRSTAAEPQRSACNTMKKTKHSYRYAAMLLFQFRVMINNDPGSRRMCEKRLINFRSETAQAALKEAKLRGRKAQYSYRNSDGNKVYFDFIGVQDLLCLGIECDPDEVWYDIVQLEDIAG